MNPACPLAACPRLLWLPSAAALVAAMGSEPRGAASAPVVDSRPVPERSFRLFVGIDVKVLYDDDFTTVTDIAHERARLDTANHDHVPLRDLGHVRFVYTTKLSRNPLTISNVTAKAVAIASREEIDLMRTQGAVQMYIDDRSTALQTEITAAAGRPSGEQTQPDGTVVDFGDPLGDAIAALNDFSSSGAGIADLEFFSEKRENDQFNALDIRATISSPTPVAQAYLIGVGRISTVEDGLQDVVFFQEIGHLGPEPKQVRVLKSGLSPGFELQKVDLHVYREGQELVSDLSAKQIAFTHEQVIEYLVLDHRASHPGETLPAQPVWSLAPSALLAAENARLFDYPLTVEIDARGRVLSVDSSLIVPDAVAAIVQELPFLPALQAGEAVASTAQFNLRDFFR